MERERKRERERERQRTLLVLAKASTQWASTSVCKCMRDDRSPTSQAQLPACAVSANRQMWRQGRIQGMCSGGNWSCSQGRHWYLSPAFTCACLCPISRIEISNGSTKSVELVSPLIDWAMITRETTTLRTKCSTSLAMVTSAEVGSSTGALERASGMARSLPLRHTVLNVYTESIA